MEYVPNRVRLSDNSEPRQSPAITQWFLKIYDAITYFLGLSKSVIYSILLRDFCRVRFRSRCRSCSKDLELYTNDEMNFSALKRRLNPFEKREKKRNKPKYIVYELESPPSLISKDKGIPQVVLNNTQEITEIFPSPKGKVELIKECIVTLEVHKEEDCPYKQCKEKEKGMGDFWNKHSVKSDISDTNESDRAVNKESNIIEPDRTITKDTPCNVQQVFKQFSPLFRALKQESSIDKPNETAPANKAKRPILRPARLIVPTPKEVKTADIVDKLGEMKINTNSEQTDTKPTDIKPNEEQNVTHQTGDTCQSYCDKKTDKTGASEEQTPRSTSAAIPEDYDIVSIAFNHAIISEKMQTAEGGLAKVLRSCFRQALRRERERTKLTDPLEEISPVIQNLERRERSCGNKKPAKRPVEKLAVEAAYIMHECDKINNFVAHAMKKTTNPSPNATMDSLNNRIDVLKDTKDALIICLRRLQEYRKNRDKLTCLILYSHPVMEEVDKTSIGAVNCFKRVKGVDAETQRRITDLLESEKRAIEEKRAKELAESRAQGPTTQNRIIGQEKLDQGRQTVPQSPKVTTHNSDIIQPAQQQTVQLVSEQTASNTRKKSWKANRASELRYASPSVGVIGGRRIITPIRTYTPQDINHDLRSTDSNLDNNSTTNSGPYRSDCNFTLHEQKVSANSEGMEIASIKQGLGKRSLSKRQECGDQGLASTPEKNVVPEPSNVKSGGGDGQHMDQIEVPSRRCLSSSTPKKASTRKEANMDAERGNKNHHNSVARRALLGYDETVPEVTEEFTDEDTIVVSSFCNSFGGTGCLETVDDNGVVEEEIVDEGEAKLDIEHKVGEPQEFVKEAKSSCENVPQSRSGLNRSVSGNKSFNSTFNTTYDGNVTGNDTRNQSDMSRSFTSYIETNNTMDLSSLEVKPGHGDRPNKKKLEAEIKPKKKKTRGTPNQHLEDKPIPKAKGKGDAGFSADFNVQTHDTEADSKHVNVSFKDDTRVQENTKPKGNDSYPPELETKKKPFEPKPMHYEHWQRIDQREIHMIPDHVHYKNESKLKDVEEMYSVSGGKNKKRKKRKEKKGKGKQKGGGTKDSDEEEEWFYE